ncbi:5306_t:CDS:2 [Cetraspora pellucida]|uniref:5306_t:CDS:1 n=1 Tax=Cetraspora pellucida TaxID=1433469 RepID=A0A9N9J3G0_9GLOM|nr:5306_t:CDS:2 [Cetraspora pellucida]
MHSKSPEIKKTFIDLVLENAETAFEKLKNKRLSDKELGDKGLDVTKRGKELLKEIKSIDDKTGNNKFQTFIEESIDFQNLKSQFFEIDLCATYYDNINIKEDIEDELYSTIDKMNKRIDELKKSIKEWPGKGKRDDWKTIKNILALFGILNTIKRQQVGCNITESELSGGGLVRGSNDHIIQRDYRKDNVAAETAGKILIYKVAEKATHKHLDELKREINLMRDLCECSNILKFYGYCKRSGGGLSVISEWADYNLQAYLNDHQLDPTEKLSIARGIANALSYCHEKDILHYDIRTWSSPERIHGEQYGKSSDVYSFALVMWAIEYQQTPFITLTSKEEIKLQIFKNKDRLELTAVDGIPDEYNDIIKNSWNHNPSERYDMKKISGLLDRLDLKHFSGQDADDLLDFNITNIDINQYPSKSDKIEEGIGHHKNKRYEDAWNLFNECYNDKPEDPYENFWVGFYYFKGHYVEQNLQEGMKFLRKASELHNPDAQYWYALALLNSSDEFEGDGYEAAMKYLRISATLNEKALKVLGRIVQTGSYGQNANDLVGQAMINKANHMKN